MGEPLYKITHRYCSLLDAIDNDFGDLTPEFIADTLEAVEGEIQEKAISVGAYYKNAQAKIKSMKEYEDAMRTKRHALEKKNERLLDYLVFNLEGANIEYVESDEFNIRFHDCPPSLVIEDDADVPMEYVSGTTVEYDKMKIKRDLKSGKDIAGVYLRYKRVLRIK